MIDISVIIPMYNAQDTIIRAVSSVINQTFKGASEIIIVNDGSTDNCVKILEDYIVANRIQNIIIINKKNGGVSSARNAGLKVAKGKYIALLDSDDEWHIKKLESQIFILKEHDDIGLIGTNWNNKKLNRFFFKRFSLLTDIPFKILMFKNFFQPSTVVFKAEIINVIGLFPEHQRYAEEGNFFFRAAKNFKCVLLNQTYLNYGFNKFGFGDGGLSGNILEMQRGEIKNLKFALHEKYCNLFFFCLAYVYSYLKYFRRIIIKKHRNR